MTITFQKSRIKLFLTQIKKVRFLALLLTKNVFSPNKQKKNIMIIKVLFSTNNQIMVRKLKFLSDLNMF